MCENRDIAKTLEKYSPRRLCDVWNTCTDVCAIYWKLFKLADKSAFDLRDIEKEVVAWKRICV